MLRAGTSPVRVPDEVDFFNLPNPSVHFTALGSTQLVTEMSTRNLHGGKKRPVGRTDKLAVICEPNIWKCGSLNLSQHCTGITLPFYISGHGGTYASTKLRFCRSCLAYWNNCCVYHSFWKGEMGGRKDRQVARVTERLVTIICNTARVTR
jgi:hypothetical protein